LELALGGQGQAEREGAFVEFERDPETSRRLLEERRKNLENDVKRIGELATEIHRKSIRDRIAKELSLPDETGNLLRCALLLAKHDNPEVDVESYERGFAQMVQELKGHPELALGTTAGVHLLNRYLFEENGFHGSRSDYSSRSNSYVNEVLDDREGLPITLSVVYLELARRLGVKEVAGLPLPGRFMIGYREKPEDEFTFLDVYDGGKELTLEEAAAIVSDDGVISRKARTPATNKEITLRMIRNLLGPLLESRSVAKEALPYLDLVLTLDPEAARERVSRAMLRERAGDKRGARLDVGWLWEHLPEGSREEQREMLEQWMERLAR
jgi:regulator of sirC expression with transglutaminase-like and TPR domain